MLPYLFRLLWGWRLAALSGALVLLGGSAWLANMPAALLGRALDRLVEGEPATFASVQPVLVLLAACVAGRAVAEWSGRYLVDSIAVAIERTEFVELLRHLLRLEVARLHRERVGALNVRVHRSVAGVVALIKVLFDRLLPMTLTVAITLGFAAPRHPAMALLMLGMVAAGAAVTAVQLRSQKGVRLSLFQSREDMGAKVTELLWGLEYVRAQGLQEHEVREAGGLADQLRRRVFQHHLRMMSFDTVKLFLEGLGFLAVVGGGAWLAVKGAVTKGDVLAFALLYVTVMRPVWELHRVFDEAFDAVLQVRELVELRGLPVDRGLRGTAQPEAQGETIVEAKALSIVHEGPSGTLPALRRLDFTVRRGEVIGIAGPSGAGKSTLLASLLGLVSQYTGSLKLFGHEVRELDKAELARRVAYVPQAPFVLRGTLRDNLRYGSQQPLSEEALLRALEQARRLELFHRLPGGLDAVLAEQGRDLSGGERQRLMLARLFLSEGSLLILDEATSALDSENELLVQQALAERTSRSAATFLVAHRLSTLSIADRILVIDAGVIVQEGSFEQLSASPGLFRELLSLQDGRSKPGSRKEAPGEQTDTRNHAVALNDRRLRYR